MKFVHQNFTAMQVLYGLLFVALVFLFFFGYKIFKKKNNEAENRVNNAAEELRAWGGTKRGHDAEGR